MKYVFLTPPVPTFSSLLVKFLGGSVHFLVKGLIPRDNLNNKVPSVPKSRSTFFYTEPEGLFCNRNWFTGSGLTSR